MNFEDLTLSQKSAFVIGYIKCFEDIREIYDIEVIKNNHTYSVDFFNDIVDKVNNESGKRAKEILKEGGDN